MLGAILRVTRTRLKELLSGWPLFEANREACLDRKLNPVKRELICGSTKRMPMLLHVAVQVSFADTGLLKILNWAATKEQVWK